MEILTCINILWYHLQITQYIVLFHYCKTAEYLKTAYIIQYLSVRIPTIFIIEMGHKTHASPTGTQNSQHLKCHDENMIKSCSR